MSRCRYIYDKMCYLGVIKEKLDMFSEFMISLPCVFKMFSHEIAINFEHCICICETQTTRASEVETAKKLNLKMKCSPHGYMNNGHDIKKINQKNNFSSLCHLIQRYIHAKVRYGPLCLIS